MMGEPWVRGEGGRWLSSPQREEVYDIVVKQLMVEGEKRWDTHKEGNYSVREGYRMLMSNKWQLEEGTSHMKLLQRQVECTPYCQLCNEHIEDDYHAYFTCSQVSPSWVAAAGLAHIITNSVLNFHNAADLLLNICSLEDSSTAGRVAALIWSIWKNRNDAVWNNAKLRPEQVGYNALQMWQTWSAANNLQNRGQQNMQIPTGVTWAKPQEYKIKLQINCNVEYMLSSCYQITSGR
ncbi:hypothetical protein TSUD_407040 [Trifolium subterraneum]|uniref:Reverse transcriptase zinc-binding domain-containing protein n=1 Tax=Trifolium subterraneum TaxID=3900 RepID=A0A2Z6NYH0_TRISU|nr:hypothetical protein TSUD_407040 [Trifolium subterraneum]